MKKPFNSNLKKYFMPDSKRNRNSQKGNEEENRTGSNKKEQRGHHKLPDDPSNNPAESISTADDTANGKYSRTNKRDEDVDNDDTRGGR
jgi:hypothetical protein